MVKCDKCIMIDRMRENEHNYWFRHHIKKYANNNESDVKSKSLESGMVICLYGN